MNVLFDLALLDVGVFGTDTVLGCIEAELVVDILLGSPVFATDRRPEAANEKALDWDVGDELGETFSDT